MEENSRKESLLKKLKKSSNKFNDNNDITPVNLNSKEESMESTFCGWEEEEEEKKMPSHSEFLAKTVNVKSDITIKENEAIESFYYTFQCIFLNSFSKIEKENIKMQTFFFPLIVSIRWSINIFMFLGYENIIT